MSLAVWVRAVDSIFGAAMLAVDLAFVAKETAGVGETRKILTSIGRTAIRTLMFIHVFAATSISGLGGESEA
jgi:hypothetical protein